MNDSIGITNSSGDLARLRLRTLRYDLPEGSDADHLRMVAEEFEAIFIKQMLESMRNTLNPENRLVDTGMAGEIYEDMLYDEYARTMSKSGGFGLVDMIVNQYRP